MPSLPSLKVKVGKPAGTCGGLARPGGKAVLLGMMRHGFFHRSGRNRPGGAQMAQPVPPPYAEGK
jgi:hypothetical protein